MIYTDQFIWLHFPKCAGTTLEILFQKNAHLIPNLHLDPVGVAQDSTIAWHDTILQRQQRDPSFKIAGRVIICPFRKLTSWLASRYTFEVTRSPHLPHDRNLLLKGHVVEQSGDINHADFYARSYLPPDLIANEKIRFIRTEFFENDFKTAFKDLIETKIIYASDLKRKTNQGKTKILAETLSFVEENAAEIYENCPYWKSLEDKIYIN